jgi:hypothetical protein
MDQIRLAKRGEGTMKTLIERLADRGQDHQASSTIETTLYDLIAAISAEVGPHDDDLVTATVVHLVNSGRVKFTDDPRNLEIV